MTETLLRMWRTIARLGFKTVAFCGVVLIGSIGAAIGKMYPLEAVLLLPLLIILIIVVGTFRNYVTNTRLSFWPRIGIVLTVAFELFNVSWWYSDYYNCVSQPGNFGCDDPLYVPGIFMIFQGKLWIKSFDLMSDAIAMGIIYPLAFWSLGWVMMKTARWVWAGRRY